MFFASDPTTVAAASDPAAVIAAWTSASIAAAGIVVGLVFGIRNLRQARRGPDGYPAWTIERPHPRGGFVLVNTGTADATDVRLELEDVDRVEGQSTWDVFHKGVRCELTILYTDRSVRPRITVHYAGPNKKPATWGPSDLPV